MSNVQSEERKAQPWIRTIVFLFVFALGAVLIVAYRPKQQPTVQADQSAITMTTDDGLQLHGNLTIPSTTGQHPAVIVLHDYGYDRHQWDAYRQQFLDAGFAVLQYDMRGFGESVLPAIPASTTEHLNSLPGDVATAVETLRQQATIDTEKISVIGVGVGASVAYVDSGSVDGIYRTVMIAPTTFGEALDGTTVKNFIPKQVYGIANTATNARLTTLLKVVDGAKTQTLNTSSTGIDVLTTPHLLTDIFTWLQS